MVVNPLINKKFDNFKTPITHQLELITKLPDEAIRPALLAFIEILKKENRRLALHQARTRRWRERHGDGRERHGDGSDNPLINNNQRHGDGHYDSEKANPFILKEERHSNGVTVTPPILSKKESKKESKIIDRRVSQKRSQIPFDLVCSEKNVSDAMSIGIPSDIIPHEWQKFHSHHLHKGTLGVNWNAAWNLWCRKSLDFSKEKSQSFAKPLTFRQAAILHNRNLMDDLILQNPPDHHVPNQATAVSKLPSLGSRASKTFPSNGKSSHSGNAKNDGGSDGWLFPKGSS